MLTRMSGRRLQHRKLRFAPGERARLPESGNHKLDQERPLTLARGRQVLPVVVEIREEGLLTHRPGSTRRQTAGSTSRCHMHRVPLGQPRRRRGRPIPRSAVRVHTETGRAQPSMSESTPLSANVCTKLAAPLMERSSVNVAVLERSGRTVALPV